VKNSGCYFRSIELTNVKSFGGDAQKLSFMDGEGRLAQWTLLLGDNGLGKTTILQCLCKLSADMQRPLKDDPTLYLPRLVADVKAREDKTRSPLARVGNQATKISVEMVINQSLGDLGKAASKTFNIDCRMESGRLLTCNIASNEFSALQPIGYGAFRRFGPTKLGVELNPDACETLFNENVALIDVDEWLLRADYAAAKSKGADAKRKLELIKQLLVALLPEVSDIRIPSSGANVPVPEAKTPDGWVPVRELSTGYKATMAWATDFMARMLERYPNSANPCAEPAVVLIDQIDTHLHPKWQRQLIADLSRIFPATQFIVTAHSPLMVQAMPEANIAVLRRNGEGVRICNQLDDIRGWRLDQIVASELFEEQPTRDVETNDKLARRRELLVKKQLPVSERAELKKLNEWADKLPTADTLEDIRAMDIIRRASEKIKPSET